jgi:hypothetical protein
MRKQNPSPVVEAETPAVGTKALIGGIWEPLPNDVWIPLRESKRVFQTGPTHTRVNIKRGLIPPPMSLGPRTNGWTGLMINEHRRKLAAKYQAEQAAAAQNKR